ncbi:MAG: type II toxin-antitoxin system RelE/ParE family toxin [Ignavibacteriaceae bacterium]
MTVEFLESAHNEYREAIDFYNLQSNGLGSKFAAEIDSTISIIKNYPESYSEYTKHTRKAVVNVFPYNVIYTIHKNLISVIAIAHQHRKPNYWLKR